jgi:predicted ester cyclase
MATAREVVERGNAAFNAHDTDRIRANYADDVEFMAPGDVMLRGSGAATEYAMSWLRAFPDARLRIDSMIAEGECVAAEFTFEGTHTAPLMSPEGEIAPTNRHMTGHGTEIWRVRGDKIVEEHLYFDQLDVLAQLGVVQTPSRA